MHSSRFSVSGLLKPPGQFLLLAHLTREKTEAPEVTHPDLETPLVVGKGLSPDVPPALAKPTALRCLPALETGPWHLGWVPSQGRSWSDLSLVVMRGSCCLSLGAAAAAEDILTVAVFSFSVSWVPSCCLDSSSSAHSPPLNTER